MMIAAMMGGIAFQKDLGAVHSLAHPLSTECGMHHGLANAVCLPTVMRFNRTAAAIHYVRLAGLFGKSTLEVSEDEAIVYAINEVTNLNEQLGLPRRLRDCDVPEDLLEKLADKAFEDPCHLTNPRKCTRDDMLTLYQEAW